MKDLLRIADLAPADLALLLEEAAAAKRNPHLHADLLRGDSVALYFAKPSTRTRLALQTAVVRLGGTPLALTPGQLQLTRGESIQDTARVASQYVRAIVVLGFADADLHELAAAASVPVINALTDGHDPIQTLAALLTLQQRWGGLAGRKLAYLGQGGSVAHSLLEAAPLAGMSVAVATPHDLQPHPEVVARARTLAVERGLLVHLTSEPIDAVQGADAVITEAWRPAHDLTGARQPQTDALERFSVDQRLLAHARPDVLLLHCQPAYLGQEATSQVIDGPRSRVLDLAENLLPVAQAILSTLVAGNLQGHTTASAVPGDSSTRTTSLTSPTPHRDDL